MPRKYTDTHRSKAITDRKKLQVGNKPAVVQLGFSLAPGRITLVNQLLKAWK